jgi:hypothetical protein
MLGCHIYILKNVPLSLLEASTIRKKGEREMEPFIITLITFVDLNCVFRYKHLVLNMFLGSLLCLATLAVLKVKLRSMQRSLLVSGVGSHLSLT